MKKKLFCTFLLSFCTLKADTFFSNFSSFSPNYDINTGTSLNDGSGNDLQRSFSFSSQSSFHLLEIDFVASMFDSGQPNQVTLTLSSDTNGHPGTAIESFSFTGDMGVFGTVAPVLNGVSVLNPLLVAGQTYWLTAEAPNGANIIWNFNNLSPNDSGVQDEFVGGQWLSSSATRGVFDIVGTPEPSSLLLIVTGLSMLGFAVCRKYRHSSPIE